MKKQDSSKASDFDYNKYKIEATNNDVSNISKIYKPKWWEYIPFVGAFGYQIRMGIEISGIDRGTLRKQIMRRFVITMFLMLIYPYFLIMMITPMLLHNIIRKSLLSTMEMIKNGQL